MKYTLNDLKYLIPIILFFLFILGLVVFAKNSHLGSQSMKYRFWGTFSLTSVFLLAFSMAILDSGERRKKKAQKDKLIQQTQKVKEPGINVFGFVRFGLVMGPTFLILPTYLSFLLPSEIYRNLIAPFSPFFVIYIVFEIVCYLFVIIGCLYWWIQVKLKGLPEKIPLEEVREFIDRGSGTEADPCIIESINNHPLMLFLNDSNLFVKIQNCYLERIVVTSCQNVRIVDCNIWSLAIQHCSKIYVNQSTLRRTLKLWYSENSEIEDCSAKWLKIYGSKSNIIKNCVIKKLKIDKYSGINTFEKNQIPEKLLAKFEKKPWFREGNYNNIPS